ncbi:MAG: NADH-quinone oxidoreductase subunit A [Planctomycetota bacterium]
MRRPCGEEPVGSAWFRFSNRFTTVALACLIFDVELALLFPILPRCLEWLAMGKGGGFGRRRQAGAQWRLFRAGCRGSRKDRTSVLPDINLQQLRMPSGTLLVCSSENLANHPERELPKPPQLRTTVFAQQLDALVTIGAEQLAAADRLFCKSQLPDFGGQKPTDKGLSVTDCTHGCLAAVEVATRAMDDPWHTTAWRGRVILVQCSCRHVGFFTVCAGCANGAAAILMSERPAHVKARIQNGARRRVPRFPLVNKARAFCARAFLADQCRSTIDKDESGEDRTGGIGDLVAKKHHRQLALESLSVVFWHLQRACRSIAVCRIFALLWATRAARLVIARRFGYIGRPAGRRSGGRAAERCGRHQKNAAGQILRSIRVLVPADH